MTNEADEPDRVHTIPLSRRQALALGVSGLTGLAGCSSLSNSSPQSTTTQTTPASEKLRVSPEFALDEATVELDIGSFANADAPLSATLRLYSSPNLAPDNQTKLAEKSIEQTAQTATYTLTPKFERGYAQCFHITVEVSEPTSHGETEVYRSEKARIPFYNAARDKEMLRVGGNFRPTFDEWNDADTKIQKAELWFNEPAESPFDVPAVDESNYDPEWYNYKDLTITALLRYPIFEDYDETSSKPPRFEWTIVNLDLSEWETLESFRWNSIASQELETGKRTFDDELEAGEMTVLSYKTLSSSIASTNLTKDASTASTPFEEYHKNRTGGYYMSTKANPLKFAAGRTFAKRAAIQFEEALDNPSTNQLNKQEYVKATALKTFVGRMPYSFRVGGYSQSPEETLTSWYKARSSDKNFGGNCQDGTNLFNGIGVHLLDVGVASITMNDGSHMTAGLINLPSPELTGNHQSPVATEPYTLDTSVGSISLVECTRNYPTIGWKLDAFGFGLLTYLMNGSINSHIPVNDSFEPDQNGSVRAPASTPQIPWDYDAVAPTVKNLDAHRDED